ncbi:MAG: competence protein ComEA, partial [Pseudonocardiales bacterium]|nr:competence protein ComEA [Pseudonocardiales bacterium]
PVRGAGRPGRGERGRVERRVRAALGGEALGGEALGGDVPDAAAMGGDVPDAAATGGAPPSGATPGGGVRVEVTPELLPWLPGYDVGLPAASAPGAPERPPPRHGSPPPARPAALGGFDRLRQLRLDPGRRGAAAVAAAAVLAAAVTLVWVLAARPRADAVNATEGGAIGGGAPPSAVSAPSGTSAAPLGAPSSSPSAAAVVVDVAGRVRHPGVYRLPAGSRVNDALRAAGGALSGVQLSTLNLAAKLTDGQQIAVGLPGTASAGGAPPGVAGGGFGSAGAPVAPSGPVNLNTASLEQLDALPGVGPVLAQHILDWRAAHGQFSSVDQLKDVSGIGPAKFAALRGLVSV